MPTAEEWRRAPAYAGGSESAANAGALDVLQRERAKLQGDPQFAGDVASLDRQAARLGGDAAAPSANADKLLALVGGAGAGAAATASKADQLLALVTKADTSDPEGNKDARDRMVDMSPATSTTAPWLQRAINAVPAARAAQMFMTPQGRAVGRGIVTGGLGAGGDAEQFLANDVPRIAGQVFPNAGLGHPATEDQTILPTTQDMSRHLTQIGIPANPEHAKAEGVGNFVGGAVAPTIASENWITRPAMAKMGKAQQLGEEAAQSVGGAARAGQERIVGQHPLPGPMADPALPTPVKPRYPGPLADEAIPVVPVTPKPPVRTAASRLDEELAGHVATQAEKLAAEKQAVYEAYKAQPAPHGIDLEDFKADLAQRIARAGTDEEATTLRKVLNRVHTIEAESDTQFESLDKLRRQLGKKAAFGETPSGYEAIGKTQARELNQALGERMKAEHPAYGEYTEKYAKLSKAGDTIANVKDMASTLKTPSAVDDAIKALGDGGVQKLDSLAVKHVQSAMGRKSGQALEDAYTDLAPSLQKLPEARAAAEKLLQRNQLELANQGIVDNILKAHGERVKGAAAGYAADVKGAEKAAADVNKAALAAHANEAEGAARGFSAKVRANEAAKQTAASYTPMLNNLQQDIAPARRISVLRSMNDKMLADGIIGPAEHAGFGAQIEKAANAAEKQKALQTLSKYVAYTLTGNYMISFGGPHLVSYLQK